MIQPFLENSLAEDIKNKIATVKLNDTKVVSDLTKTIEGNVCVIQFLVPAGITEINNMKVLDATQNILSNVQLYLPVTSELRLKYRMEVTHE